LCHYNTPVATLIPRPRSGKDLLWYDVLEEEGATSYLEQVLDKRDTIQVTTEMQSMLTEQLVDAHWKDELYKLALHSRERARGGKM